MSDLYKQFSTSDGRFVRFQIQGKKFYIIRGQGGEVKSKDVFPLKAAKTIAYDILDMTEEVRSNSTKPSRVDQVLSTRKELRPEQAEKHIRDVIRNSQKNDKLGKIETVLDRNPEIGVQGHSYDHIEKVKEQVADAIYETFGSKYFVSAQFKKMYERRWDKGQARWWLRRLNEDSLIVKDKVDDLDDFHGNTTYKYRLSDNTLKRMEKGPLASDANNSWKYKRRMLPEQYRPKKA